MKKATQEKRQERKAAKTLSAILLVFILTWTPYNVLAVMKGILGPEQSEVFFTFPFWLRQELKESLRLFVCPCGTSLSKHSILHLSLSGLSQVSLCSGSGLRKTDGA